MSSNRKNLARRFSAKHEVVVACKHGAACRPWREQVEWAVSALVLSARSYEFFDVWLYVNHV